MPSSKKRIVVVGSINMDLVARTTRIPAPGETLLGNSFVTAPGGKGANQAVAAAKLAGEETEVHLVGRVGDDDFGQRLLTGLAAHRVGISHVTTSEGIASGVAMILVDKKGENTIVVAPGANAKLTTRDIDAAEEIIAGASAVLLQLEIPLEIVSHVIAICQRLGVFVLLDPAPVPPGGLPRPMYGVNLLTPNQLEAESLVGIKPRPGTMPKRVADPKQIASRLLDLGSAAVVLKRGKKGAMLLARDGVIRTIRPLKVKVIDTTAAGDAFTAALAVGHVEGMDLPQTALFANAAGAACCATFGAQPSLPTRDAVERLLAP